MGAGVAQEVETTKPNVIFILADDMRNDSLSMNGSEISTTPHIDQLAKEGVYFSNALVTSPICGPSRANLFTGQWERKNQIGFTSISNNFVTKEAFENSFQIQMKNAGYSTAFIGKHHTKIIDAKSTALKTQIDFSYFKGGHLGFHPGDKSKTFSNLKNRSQTEGFMEACEAYLSQGSEYDYFYENADPSLKGMLEKRDPEKPFCVWVNFNLPHQASLGGMGSKPGDPKFYSELYEEEVGQMKIAEEYDGPVQLPENVLTRDELEKYYKFNKKSLLSARLKTARAVHGIDQFVANIRGLLEKIEEDDNTIIVFFSDNGLLYGEHGLGGKTMLYEESIRAPLIIYSPFFDEDKRSLTLEQLVVGQDIPATILDLCSLPTPETYQGESMMPLVNATESGEAPQWRESVFIENLFTQQGYPRQDGVRTDRYKYVRFYGKEDDRDKYLPNGIEGEAPIFEQFFDLDTDPKERTNLIADPAHQELVEQYREECTALAKSLSN